MMHSSCSGLPAQATTNIKTIQTTNYYNNARPVPSAQGKGYMTGLASAAATDLTNNKCGCTQPPHMPNAWHHKVNAAAPLPALNS